MVKRTLGLGLLVGAVALSACGGDSSDGGTGGGGTASLPLDDVLPAIIDIQCDAFQQCAGDFFDLFLQNMTCEERFGRQFEDGVWEQLETAIAEGRVVYDGTKAQACLDAFRAQGCDIMTSRAPDICKQALAGTVDAGGDCTLDAECKGDLFCKVEASCPGTCSPLQAAGAGCQSSDACENGLNCDDATHQCAKPRAKGEACEGGQPSCALGLLCLGADKTTPGTCVELGEVFAEGAGQPCDLANQDWCQVGLSCVVDSVTGGNVVSTCQEPNGKGEACKYGLPSPCPSDQYCNANIGQGQLEGTCVDLPKEGEACVASGGLTPCAAYTACIDGTCRELKRNGQTCVADEACYSGYCKAGTCTSPDACAVLDL